MIVLPMSLVGTVVTITLVHFMVDTSALWAHQLKTYAFGLNHNRMYDLSSAGTGKTIAHAKLAENFLANEQGTRVLVVCPKTLMRSAWKQEFFTYMPYITVGLAEAPDANRKLVFESQCKVVVMNTDGLSFLAAQPKTWLLKHLGKKPMLIIDESSSIKNPNSIRTKAALKIAPYFDRVHLLSATPAPNSVIEIWPQAKVLDGGKRLGTRFTAFRNLMQRPVFSGPFRQWEDAPDASTITYGLLADISIRHDFDDVMTHVPAMTDTVMYYDLSHSHMKTYKTMEKQAFLEFGDETITSLNAAGLANKLLQIASGAVYNDPSSDEKGWSIIDSGRYEMIAELCEPRPHTVIFFTWKHQKQEIIKELEKRSLTYAVLDGSVKSPAVREETVNGFEAGKFRVILLHPLTGAHGLTLTKGTTIIWASPTYNADWFQQGNARIRRGRQTLPTQSITILAKGTRDFDAHDTFTGKNTRMSALNNLFANRYGDDNDSEICSCYAE
jgi:hypothetical protein